MNIKHWSENCKDKGHVEDLLCTCLYGETVLNEFQRSAL
jgi:hypothetical protein